MRNAVGICDASGFKYPLKELVKQWDGALVHPQFLDTRNPQDFIRARPESVLPYSRPEPDDTFISAPVLPSDL